MSKGLFNKLNTLSQSGDCEWHKPAMYDLSTKEGSRDLEGLVDSGAVLSVHDPIEEVANDLFEIRHPERMNDAVDRRDFVGDILSQGGSFGKWFYFPWSKRVVRYPDRDDHYDLRTARNLLLRRPEEQKKVGGATIAAYGHSVGSSIIMGMVRAGVGKTYVHGDFDTISPSNLNRMYGSMADVGLPKLVKVARAISETDPYIKQILEPEGYTSESDSVLDREPVDLMIEAIDNVSAKSHLRKYASSRRVPLIMATDLGKKSIIDIEMHNLGSVKPYLGKVSVRLNNILLEGDYTESQELRAKAKIVGIRNLSVRMAESVKEIGKSVTGIPQLGNTVTLSEALAVEAAHEVLLGRRKKSGSYQVSMDSVLKSRPPDDVLKSAGVWVDFLKHIKNS